MSSAPWFVVQTEPMRETTVRDRLEDRFAIYLPMCRLNSGRVVPLFPRYLFVGAVEQWSPIKNTIGVRSVLMDGTKPAIVRQHIVDEIRRRERRGVIPMPEHRRRGDRITVLHGPFREHLAIYLGSVGRHRERVMLELLGRMVTIEIAARDLAQL